MGIDSDNRSNLAEQNQARPKKFQLSRRGFLGGAAAVATALAFAWYRVQDEPAAKVPDNPVPTPTPTELPPVNLETITDQGLTLHLDEEGVPYGYQFPGEEVSTFDTDTYLYLQEKRNAVMSAQGEPDPALWFELAEADVLSAPTPEKPYVTELPDDILTTEELAEYGLEIFNTTNEAGASTFHIRRKAFSGNGVLEPLALLKQSLPNGEQLKKIKIVSLNTEYIPAKGLSFNAGSYTQLEPIIARFREEIDFAKEKLIQSTTEKIEELRAMIAAVATDEEYEQLNKELFKYKAHLDYYANLDDYSMLIKYAKKHNSFYGAFMMYGGLPYSMQSDEDTVLFMAAPEFSKMADSVKYSIGFDNSGKVLIDKLLQKNERQMPGPRIDQSYLNPADISENTTNTDYEFKPDSMGFIACHEFVHLVMLVLPKLAELGKLKESQFFQNMIADSDVRTAMLERSIDITGETFPLQIEDEEKFTDIVTKMLFKLAYKLWENSNFTDDSGYNFAFQIPADNFQPGGVQITQMLQHPGIQHDMAA